MADGFARTRTWVTLGAVTALAVVTASCGGGSTVGQVSTTHTLRIASDLPLQGSNKGVSQETNQALQLYLDQLHGRAGAYPVTLKTYDDATASKGAWDDETCVKNAHDHLRNGEVAVMGTFNSGCARLMVPVMNLVSDGPLLMVSHANTNPGLTKAWGPNEPDKFRPSGKPGFARVVATDERQGSAAAGFVRRTLHATRCYVLDDGGLYGKGVAGAFAAAARTQGITVVGRTSWDKGVSSYVPLFTRIQATNPDCVYIGGNLESNGVQLVRDKVAVLGSNRAVPLIGPDGFSGYTELDTDPAAQGMYVTFVGLALDQLVKASPVAASFVTAYKTRYGAPLTSSYPLYGVAALQVILAAIAASDGTRAGVDGAVFGSADLTVPASASITGQAIEINHATGDPTVTDITVLQVRSGAEAFIASQRVS